MDSQSFDYLKASQDFNPIENCSVTGRSLDYAMCLFSYEIYLSEEGIFKLQEIIDEKKEEVNDNLSMKYKKSKCSLCETEGNCVEFSSPKDSVCQCCLFEISFMYGKLKDKVEYQDESGFRVLHFEDGREIFDSVEEEELECERVVYVSSLSALGLSTDISNIKKMVRGLKEPEDYVFIQVDNSKSASCKVCSRSDLSKGVNVGVSHICERCRENLIDSAEEYIELNNELVVSYLI